MSLYDSNCNCYRFHSKNQVFIKMGNYYWNSGIFLLDANYTNDLFKKYQLLHILL